MKPDTSEMTLLSEITDDELLALGQRATDFLTSFRWCARVTETYLALEIGCKLGVFLLRIEPRLVGVPDTLWVVVGDLPPAHLVCDDTPDWSGALHSYIYEMRRWVDAVRAGDPLDDIIPVNVAPTAEHADMLSSRLSFIEERVLSGTADSE